MTPESDAVTPGHRQKGASLIDCLKYYFESQNAQPSYDEDTLGVSRNAASMFATSKSWVIDSSVVKFERRLSSSGRIPRFQHSQTTPHSVLCQTSFVPPGWHAVEQPSARSLRPNMNACVMCSRINCARSQLQMTTTTTNRHQQAPTGTNRHEQARTGTTRHQWV